MADIDDLPVTLAPPEEMPEEDEAQLLEDENDAAAGTHDPGAEDLGIPRKPPTPEERLQRISFLEAECRAAELELNHAKEVHKTAKELFDVRVTALRRPSR